MNETLFWYCLYLFSSSAGKNFRRFSKPTSLKKKKKSPWISYYCCIMNLKLSFINGNGIFLEWLVCYSEVESPAQSKQSIFRLCTFNLSGVSFMNCDDLGASLFAERCQSSMSWRIRYLMYLQESCRKLAWLDCQAWKLREWFYVFIIFLDHLKVCWFCVTFRFKIYIV